MFYGHYDKQPPFTGWEEGLGPNIPVIKNGKLYGRGGADDGYSTYGTMIAIKTVQSQNIPLPSIYLHIKDASWLHKEMSRVVVHICFTTLIR